MDVNAFMADFLHIVCQILLTPPISYFLGIAITLCVVTLVRYMIFGERR